MNVISPLIVATFIAVLLIASCVAEFLVTARTGVDAVRFAVRHIFIIPTTTTTITTCSSSNRSSGSRLRYWLPITPFHRATDSFIIIRIPLLLLLLLTAG